jgi:hypothetical protein
MPGQVRCADASIRWRFHLHRQGIREHHDANLLRRIKDDGGGLSCGDAVLGDKRIGSGNHFPSKCLMTSDRRSRSTDAEVGNPGQGERDSGMIPNGIAR